MGGTRSPKSLTPVFPRTAVRAGEPGSDHGLPEDASKLGIVYHSTPFAHGFPHDEYMHVGTRAAAEDRAHAIHPPDFGLPKNTPVYMHSMRLRGRVYPKVISDDVANDIWGNGYIDEIDEGFPSGTGYHVFPYKNHTEGESQLSYLVHRSAIVPQAREEYERPESNPLYHWRPFGPPGQRQQHLHVVSGSAWRPSSGIFGPTTGLDHRLFTAASGQFRLRPEVRAVILERLDRCIRTDSGLAGSDWQGWTRVYLMGGSASEWAGDRPNDTAQDLDVIVAIDLHEAQRHNAFEALGAGEAASALNAAFWKHFNADNWHAPFGGIWNLTAFCNQRAWYVEDIRPYAAWDLMHDGWAVVPPHLPEHIIADFSPAVIAHARAVAAEARAILRMDEPLRTREATALWHHIREHRCQAFSPEGTGWDDPGNVDEKYLAYHPHHLLQKIRELALGSSLNTAFLDKVPGMVKKASDQGIVYSHQEDRYRPGVHRFDAHDENGRNVGYAQAYERPDHVFLDAVYVTPDVRGHGVGSRLLDNAIGHFPGREIRLKPEPFGYPDPPGPDESRLRDLYRTRGFEDYQHLPEDEASGHMIRHASRLPESEIGPLYHGTTEDRARQILESGFEGGEGRHEGIVYLAPTPELAHSFAEGRVQADDGGTPAVLRVDKVRGVSAVETGYGSPALNRDAGAHYMQKAGEVLVLDPAAIHGVSRHLPGGEKREWMPPRQSKTAALAREFGVREALLVTDDFRRVIATTPRSQLVLMTLQPGEEIGAETHEDGDQHFVVLAGTGHSVTDDHRRELCEGDAFTVPAGTRHNVTSAPGDVLRLATVYAPPRHAPGTVHHTKAEAEQAERSGQDKPRKTAAILEEVRRRGYCTDEWSRWQQGQCGTYAVALTQAKPGLRFGVAGTEDWPDSHFFAHDDTHAYDSAGRHPLPYRGPHGDLTQNDLDADPEDFGIPEEESGPEGPEPNLAAAREHARRNRILEGGFGPKTAVSLDENVRSWPIDRDDQLAAMDPLTRASALAQEAVRSRHPLVARPLHVRDGESSVVLSAWLARHGHPLARTAYITGQPGTDYSCTGRGPDGEPAVALHPDRRDYGTLAHEAAHLIDDHETGRMHRAPHGPDGAHNDGWARHYATLLNTLSAGAGDDFLAERDYERSAMRHEAASQGGGYDPGEMLPRWNPDSSNYGWCERCHRKHDNGHEYSAHEAELGERPHGSVPWDYEGDRTPNGDAFYHGTHRKLHPGDLITPGHEGNYGSGADDHVYFTSHRGMGSVWAHDSIAARQEAFGEDISHLRPHVYEVRPTGTFHLDDANADNYDREYQDYKSQHPLRVKREIPYDYDGGIKFEAAVHEASAERTDGLREEWHPGDQAHYEYHCNESPDSPDAPLWYRSHQQVRVLGRDRDEDLDAPIDERLEEGMPRAYRVRFGDGHEGTAIEDELLTHPRHFTRPDPPAMPKTASSTDGVSQRPKRTPGSAMVYLDVPHGVVQQHEGQETGHHIALAYLPRKIDDEAFGRVVDRAREAAARHAPMKATISGGMIFPPGTPPDRRRASVVPVHAPGIHELHAEFGDFDRAHYEAYTPHVTRAQLGGHQADPPPHPEVSFPVTHLHVRRGDEVHSFPLTGPSQREAAAEGSGGPWYHLTTVELRPGQSVAPTPWHEGDDGFLHFSDHPRDAQRKGLEVGRALGRRGNMNIYEVHPEGPFEQNPDDPGRYGTLYRTRHPLRVVRRFDPSRREAVSGYDGLGDRTAMIYLELPPGTVRPVPGGVDDHHITIIYLGKNVSDKAWAKACRRAKEAAAQCPPMDGVLRGIDIFPPSKSSDGKVPAFVPAYVGGIGRLRRLLEDLSASEHKDFRPHVSLAYLEEGDSLPAPHPAVHLRFTHVHLKRGDEIIGYPLGGGVRKMAVETPAWAGEPAGDIDEGTAIYGGMEIEHPDDTPWHDEEAMRKARYERGRIDPQQGSLHTVQSWLTRENLDYLDQNRHKLYDEHEPVELLRDHATGRDIVLNGNHKITVARERGLPRLMPAKIVHVNE